jgi:hypothetical protein
MAKFENHGDVFGEDFLDCLAESFAAGRFGSLLIAAVPTILGVDARSTGRAARGISLPIGWSATISTAICV